MTEKTNRVNFSNRIIGLEKCESYTASQHLLAASHISKKRSRPN